MAFWTLEMTATLPSKSVLMPIFGRSARFDDLQGARKELGPYYGGEEQQRSLPQMWRDLRDRGNLVTTWLEEGDDPDLRVPVYSMAGVFVDADFAAVLERTEGVRPGHLAVAEYVAEGTGLLDLEQIREAQKGGGLNFVVLHSHFFGLGGTETRFAQEVEMASQALFSSLRGYHLRSFYHESVDSTLFGWLRSAGLRPVPARRRRDKTEPERQLFRITREEAEHEPGARISALFVEYRALFGLKGTFRDLLEVAMRGSTDKQIAEALSLSVPAVKRRWERLYAHVEARYPELWRAWAGEAVDSARGSERRRHLLNYFRDHPEEMRPWVD